MTLMGKPNLAPDGGAVPEFMRQVITDEAPASARVVAEQAVLALNASMMTLYDQSLTRFKQNIRDKVPIILALFTGQGGQMILYRPGKAPEIAPPVPVVYQPVDASEGFYGMRRGSVPTASTVCRLLWL